jgi:hypothetical protein
MKNNTTYLVMAAAPLIAQESQDSVGSLITDPLNDKSQYCMGFLQIETGGFEETKNGIDVKENDLQYNITALWIVRQSELRLGLDTVVQNLNLRGREIAEDLNGTSPLLLGLKWVLPQKGWMPQIGFTGTFIFR